MTTRKITGFTSHALILAFVSAMAFSPTASATAPCSAEIDALKAALHDICWYSRKCRGLSHKLDSTQRKLKKGKFRRAAHKLADFGWIVENMANRRWAKFSKADYQGLMDPHYVAVANCIANGGVSAPPPDDDTGTGGDEPPPILVPF